MNKIFVIGIGFKPLEEKAKKSLFNSLYIICPQVLYELFKKYEEFAKVKEKIFVIKKINEMIDFIKENLEKGNIAVLANGDPLYYGIGESIIKVFGKDKVEIFPDLSCLQKGLALIKKSAPNIQTLTFHGRELDVDSLLQILSKQRIIAILTDSKNSPNIIAKELLSRCKDLAKEFKFYVFERLGFDDERVSCLELDENLLSQTFKEPNFVIIERRFKGNEDADSLPCLESEAEGEILFGFEEREIKHVRGMITKDEVRACVLHKLRPPRRGVVWDVGAGSGSVSLELASLSKDLEIYAIEKGDTTLLEENLKSFNIKNVRVIKGEAPECLQGLPAPDRVFIGGSGGKLQEILDYLFSIPSLKIIVISAITLETLIDSIKILEGKNFKVDITQVQATRYEYKHGKIFFKALNPVIIVRGVRGKE